MSDKRGFFFVYLIDPVSVAVSTVFGIGYAKKAPGTFGSIPGIGLGYLLHSLNHSWLAAAILFGATLLALAAISRTERFWNTHDDQRIVIDEVIGAAIPIAFLPAHWFYYVAGFAIFRWLDIKKPGPIGWADRDLPGSFGTLLDDVIAGIFTLLILLPVALF